MLDLSAQGEDLDVGAVRKYVPVGRLSAAAEAWFAQAFIGGRAPSAQLTYQGPTRAFPFRKGEGEFRARARVENAVLSYQSGWTPASELVADVEFHNQGMHIRAAGGRVSGLRVTSASASVADFRNTELRVQATARADVHEGLAFLQQSPLGPTLGQQFARLRGSGAMQADVRLHLPLRRMGDREIEVTAALTEAAVSLQGLDAPATDVSGRLTVRNTLLAAADLHGQWLAGRPACP